MPRFLIVDDSTIQLRFTENLIRTHLPHTEILSAASGNAAIKVLEVEPVDLVLTDLRMEDGDGLQLVQEIKAKYPLVPVVLMTSYGSEETATAALLAGAASYIPKRRLDSDLIPTVENVLTLSQSGRRKLRLLQSLERCESTFVLENDVSLIAPLIDHVQEQIVRTRQFDASDVTRIGVALHETLTNAIYHGNLELSSDLRQEDESIFYLLADQRRIEAPYSNRRVFITTKISARELEFVIRDQGPGFNVKKVLDPDLPLDLERIGGRGLLLIRSFMDVVFHNALGNELHMLKYSASSRRGAEAPGPKTEHRTHRTEVAGPPDEALQPTHSNRLMPF